MFSRVTRDRGRLRDGIRLDVLNTRQERQQRFDHGRLGRPMQVADVQHRRQCIRFSAIGSITDHSDFFIVFSFINFGQPNFGEAPLRVGAVRQERSRIADHPVPLNSASACRVVASDDAGTTDATANSGRSEPRAPHQSFTKLDRRAEPAAIATPRFSRSGPPGMPSRPSRSKEFGQGPC